MHVVTLLATCNRRKGPHALARIVSRDGEAVFEVRVAVYGQPGGGIKGDWGMIPLTENASTNAYCDSCNKEFPVMLGVLRAAHRDRRVVALEPLGMWKDGVGVLRRRRNRGQQE